MKSLRLSLIGPVARRHVCNAGGGDAGEREWLREDIGRLENELLIASSIAADLFSTFSRLA